jgi:hypothetical protein
MDASSLLPATTSTRFARRDEQLSGLNSLSKIAYILKTSLKIKQPETGHTKTNGNGLGKQMGQQRIKWVKDRNKRVHTYYT